MIRYNYVTWDWFLMFIYLLVNKAKMYRNNIYYNVVVRNRDICNYHTVLS